MSKFARSIIVAIVFVNTAFTVLGQKSPQAKCGSMIHMQALLNRDPQARALHEQNQKQAKTLKQEYLLRSPESRQQGDLSMNTLNSPVYIPVVVHIVLPNALQISDQDVQRQIDKLNIDFAGLNADSAAIPAAFRPLFGKSKIQFTLARRTPSGALSNGIERRNSSTQSNISLTTDPIKRTAQGGLDAWDFNKYLNLWVGLDASGLGVLGYASFPGTDIPANQGVFINALSWGNNSCYVVPQFGLGRTAVHEIGHYFGLYHIWGDESGCAGDDFRQLSGTCTLPASLLFGDTPNQANSTSGCLNGERTDACSPTAPGFMYQNYMDYTDDACYAMFTLKQVERMEYVLENCRASYLTSDGATPPTGALITDVSPIAAVNPGGFEFIGCTLTNYAASICSGSIIPKVRISNNGLDTLTSVKVGMTVNGGPAVIVNVTTVLPIGFSTVVSFPATTLSNGQQTLKFFTQDPNNLPDQVPANDTLTLTLMVAGPAITGPIVEGFESPAFPTQGWTVLNPDPASLTWTRNTAASKSGVASAYINSFNYSDTAQLDYLVSPLVDVNGADSVLVSFERAYQRSTTGSNFSDTLMIQLSINCDTINFPITAWKKGGNALASVPGTFAGDWVPAAADWVQERINIKPLLPAGTNSVQVAFVSRNGHGQNLYLDDINVSTIILPKADASLRTFANVQPKICANNLTPIVEISNNGTDPLTSARIVYRITGPSSFNVTDSLEWTGNLITGAVASVPLKPIILLAPGTYRFLAYTKLPNGGIDSQTSNDTIRLTARYFATVPAPVFQGFESGTFPPPNWGLVNQDGQRTWLRTTLASSSGIASVLIDNYNYDARGTDDDIESPIVSYNGIDSAKLTFSLAHATYAYPGSTGIPLDTLQILVTKDCGNTFTMVYNKWGEDLQTVNNPNTPYTDFFIPNQSQWREESVDLTSALGSSGLAQIIIRSKGNYGNSLFIDNVNITTKILPLKLKMNGYMISPNPFNSSFSVQHYIKPANLRGIQVMNASGQVVFKQNFNGNAQSYIDIDLSRYAAGVYFVRLIYNDKVVTDRVIKRS